MKAVVKNKTVIKRCSGAVVCKYVCVCLHPFTVKASYIWNSWNVRAEVNKVALKAFLF